MYMVLDDIERLIYDMVMANKVTHLVFAKLTNLFDPVKHNLYTNHYIHTLPLLLNGDTLIRRESIRDFSDML